MLRLDQIFALIAESTNAIEPGILGFPSRSLSILAMLARIPFAEVSSSVSAAKPRTEILSAGCGIELLTETPYSGKSPKSKC